MTTMLASDLPLPRIGRGKVRDIYAVGDDRVLLLTTDRISAITPGFFGFRDDGALKPGIGSSNIS